MKYNDAIKIIKEYYTKGGRIRNRIQKRFLNEKQKYKKGYEIRIRIKNDIDYKNLIQSLSICKIKAGKPYKQHTYKIIPIYGKKQVEWFKKEII